MVVGGGQHERRVSVEVLGISVSAVGEQRHETVVVAVAGGPQQGLAQLGLGHRLELALQHTAQRRHVALRRHRHQRTARQRQIDSLLTLHHASSGQRPCNGTVSVHRSVCMSRRSIAAAMCNRFLATAADIDRQLLCGPRPSRTAASVADLTDLALASLGI